ncbi:DUF4886 domain-containing protein [Sphingobacterium thalpophilum]|uniref:DUF4886 domain-containing protein n=1 Tax=Sphingobacterium thalpophilum TaxID=259 RepID=A0ABV4H8Q8_9SPHI
MKTKQIFPFSILIIFLFAGTPSQAQQQPLDDGVLRVLAIGNSFSEDAIEQNLYELAKAGKKKIVIGNLYIGGAPLSLHVNNAKEDKPAYRYRKINMDGQMSEKSNQRLSEALKDEAWDYVSFQQASPLSGNYDSYAKDLPTLYEYVTKQVRFPETKYILHQTWAYQNGSSHEGFIKYDRSQGKMYADIVKTSADVFSWGNFEILVPSGTAIQNARTSFIGDNFTRDGYHLNLDYGRFVAACTWYEALFHEPVKSNTFLPLKVTYIEGQIAREAAHNAVYAPYNVTPLTNFQYMN